MAKRSKRRADWLSHAQVEMLESRQLLSGTTATATAIVTTANPILTGQVVAFTATVTAAGGTPTGIVTFMDGSNVLGTPTLNPTTHQAIDFVNTLTAGSHSITAVYGGDTSYATSTSTAINEIVNSTDVATTTTLATTSSTVGINQTVAFTATVTSNSGTPTGTVTFMDGANVMGTVTINPTTHQAIDFVNPLPMGTDTITAVYAGTTGYATSTSSAVTETVSANTATVTLAATESTLQVGQTVAFIATVTGTGGSPTGTVTFMDGSTTLGTTNVVAGSQEALYFTASLAAGSHSITATYSGDATFASATSSTLNETVNSPATTGITLQATNNDTTIVYGSVVGFIATVTADSGSPGGTVTFMDGSNIMGTAALNTTTNQAIDFINVLSIGTHTITAVYGGAMGFAGATSTAVTETVNSAANDGTTTTLASSGNPIVFGQTVAFVATVTSDGGSPGGTVTFMDGSNIIGTAPLNTSTNQAIDFVNPLAVGAHTITAVYAGEGAFGASSSAVLNESVNTSNDATNITIATTANPTFVGQVIALTATVTAAGGTPAGIVTFMDGSTVIGTPTIDPTTHEAIDFLNSLTTGNHTIKAVYAGGSGFLASTSSSIVETVDAVQTFPTTITLVASNNPIVNGQVVAFVATVTSTNGNPGGTVTFKDGTTVLGTVALNTTTNQAIDFTNGLAVGTHNITATYGGASGFAAGTSSAVSEVVNKSGTNLTLSSSSATIGQNVTMTATVATPAGGVPTGTVTFTASASGLGSISLGSATLNSSGTATISEYNLFTAAYTITASYSGDGTHAASNATAALSVIVPASPITTSDGLQYQVITAGSGAAAATGQVVEVDYTGYLTNGTKFDSSLNAGRTPFEFQLGPNTQGQEAVIQGWEEGIPGMQVGETRVLVIPSSLAYGSSGQGSIPANATLVFVVKMLAVNQPMLTIAGGAASTPLLNNQAPSMATGTLFANTTVGSTSAASTFTLDSADTSFNLEGTTSPIVEISGADPNDFILTQPTNLLTNEGENTFTIEFKPTATGTRTATITIATNSTGTPPSTFTFTVTGTGQ